MFTMLIIPQRAARTQAFFAHLSENLESKPPNRPYKIPHRSYLPRCRAKTASSRGGACRGPAVIRIVSIIPTRVPSEPLWNRRSIHTTRNIQSKNFLLYYTSINLSSPLKMEKSGKHFTKPTLYPVLAYTLLYRLFFSCLSTVLYFLFVYFSIFSFL